MNLLGKLKKLKNDYWKHSDLIFFKITCFFVYFFVYFNMKEYYVYKHTRLDKQEVFYIGIGTKNKTSKFTSSIYKRAYSKASRNNFWKSITAKTKYEVDIIYESNCILDVNEKETFYIKFYGRRDLKKGSLCNLTDGADTGNRGRHCSDEHKRKISIANKGRIKTEAERKHQSDMMKGRIVSEETRKKLSERGLGRKLSFEHFEKLQKVNKGKIISEETRNKIRKSLLGKTCKPIKKINMDGTIENFKSVNEVVEKYPSYKITSIRKACIKILKAYKKSIWSWSLEV